MQTDFAAFCEKQDMWLADFALFTALQAHFRAERAKGIDEEEYLTFAVDTIDFLTEEQQKDYFESACWNTWPRTLRKRNAASLKKWTRLLADAIAEEKFYQYLFFTQWQALKAYANEKGISIMGDTPIFMAYDSADVWANQKLFQLDSMGFPTVVAGVPPYYFCAEGQLWGNPLYDWKAHKKTGYLWWTERIHKACQEHGMFIAGEIEKMGIFDILYDGSTGIPGAAWMLKKGTDLGFNIFDLSDRMRVRGWQIASYTLPVNCQDMAIQRVLIRHGFSHDMAQLLIDDLQRSIEYLRKNPMTHSLDEKTAGGYHH